MRRTYISPEYKLTRVYGTFNMIEESNFFSSKMLDIEDNISISIEDIIYYQNIDGEQLDFSVESSSNPEFYSPNTDKKNNHTLVIDDTQSRSQKEGNTRWILTIDLKSILDVYLFSIMKKYRSFEGIKNGMVQSNNINVALKQYITENVYNRYKLSNIDLFISYKDLRNQNILRYKNNWNQDIISNENKFTKIQTETSTDGSILKVIFNQDKNSTDYSFDYFFNLNFVKK